jgi:hypothetical protein
MYCFMTLYKVKTSMKPLLVQEQEYFQYPRNAKYLHPVINFLKNNDVLSNHKLIFFSILTLCKWNQVCIFARVLFRMVCEIKYNILFIKDVFTFIDGKVF